MTNLWPGWEEWTPELAREFAMEVERAKQTGLLPLPGREPPRKRRVPAVHGSARGQAADVRGVPGEGAGADSSAEECRELPELRGGGAGEPDEVPAVRAEAKPRAARSRRQRSLAELVAEKVDDVMAVTVAGLHERIDVLTRRMEKLEAKGKRK